MSNCLTKVVQFRVFVMHFRDNTRSTACTEELRKHEIFSLMFCSEQTVSLRVHFS